MMPLLLIFLTACSLVRNTTITITSDLFSKAASGLQEEYNWDYFDHATPSNLQLIEGIWSLDKDNLDLLFSLTKGHGGYGYVVPETNFYISSLKENEDEKSLEKAIFHYAKAIKYGLTYLNEKGISFSSLKKEFLEKQSLTATLNKSLSLENERDVETVFFLAQAWAAAINLQRDRTELLSELPLVKSLFDWVCLPFPDFSDGSCYIFYGIYKSSRPKMLGGDHEGAEKMFLSGIKSHPENLLIRVSYLQYLILPQIDEEKYLVQKEYLLKKFQEFNLKNNWYPDHYGKESFKIKRLNIFNALAQKRFSVMIDREKELF